MVKQVVKMDLAQIEERVFNDVMNNSREILETFKFNMIYSTKLTTSLKKKTAQGLKEFRAQNKFNDSEYEKYIKSF